MLINCTERVAKVKLLVKYEQMLQLVHITRLPIFSDFPFNVAILRFLYIPFSLSTTQHQLNAQRLPTAQNESEGHKVLVKYECFSLPIFSEFFLI
jgi:hypothetical protein